MLVLPTGCAGTPLDYFVGVRIGYKAASCTPMGGCWDALDSSCMAGLMWPTEWWAHCLAAYIQASRATQLLQRAPGDNSTRRTCHGAMC